MKSSTKLQKLKWIRQKKKKTELANVKMNFWGNTINNQMIPAKRKR